MASFVPSFFPLDILDGTWDIIESVSEGFFTYSWTGGSLMDNTLDDRSRNRKIIPRFSGLDFKLSSRFCMTSLLPGR